MLIIFLRKYEEIHIGDDIKIKVMQTSNGSVKLCFDAPKEIVIKRIKKSEEDKKQLLDEHCERISI